MAESIPLPTPSPLSATPAHPAIQTALDADHLKLLEIGFYISSVVTALRFIWLFFMLAIFSIGGFGAAFAARHSPQVNPQNAPPIFFFFILAAVFGALILFTIIFAALEFYAGRCLRDRKHPVFIQVIAAIYCLSIPWGTALGVCTFMVLNRPSVQPLFARSATAS